MLLQAALNGPFTTDDHPAMPITPAQLARDAAACAAGGARAMHVHPRDGEGLERLDAEVVDPVVRVVREACGLPVGVSTGAWIEPVLERRIALVSAWTEPDYASVNVSEPGSERMMEALLDAGVGVEAGVVSVEDARALGAFDLAARLTRVLVEPMEIAAATAVELVDGIHAALDAEGITAPRLQHGDGESAWVLIVDAVRRGCDTRVGFEDTLALPDGTRAPDNAALVAAAAALGAGR